MIIFLLFYITGVVAAYLFQRWIYRKTDHYTWATVIFSMRESLTSWFYFIFSIVAFIVDTKIKSKPPTWL